MSGKGKMLDKLNDEVRIPNNPNIEKSKEEEERVESGE